MSLLTTIETQNSIANQVALVTESLHIITAFCKESALKYIESNIKHDLTEKKILVRFLLADILSGATDLSLYEYCKSNGWQLFVRFDLHAKAYIFDRKRYIMGSSNLTRKGFGLSNHSNAELSCLADIDKDDLIKIDRLFDDAVLMDDELYDLMESEYQNAKSDNSLSTKATGWSTSIINRFSAKRDVLFSDDFPKTNSASTSDICDYDFLGFDYIPTNEETKECFMNCNAYLWLYNLVNSSPNKSMYFGEIVKCLHDTIVNEPKPYRKDIKVLLSNLLNWIEFLEVDGIKIDTPKHSQCIRII